MYKLLSLLFCLVVFASFTTQKTLVKEASVLRDDSAGVTARHFNSGAIDGWQQRDFVYTGNGINEETIWDKFWDWFWQNINEVLHGRVKGKVAQLFFILLGITAIVFLVLKITGMDVMQIFTGKNSTVEIPYSESSENIHEIGFEEEIEKAVSGKNFRLAVRLLYLNLLKKLSDSGAIDWKPGKTNLAYLFEIQNQEQRQKFGLLTRQFEFVWYGDFKVDEADFRQINHSFQQFNPKLK